MEVCKKYHNLRSNIDLVHNLRSNIDLIHNLRSNIDLRCLIDCISMVI